MLKGGPGRRVFRTVAAVSGTCHVITVWELGRHGPLRIIAYDPTTSISYEAQMCRAERVCLRCTSEDNRVWRKIILRRLSLRRQKARATATAESKCRGGIHPSAKRRMSLNKTLLSTVWRVPAVGVCTLLLRVRASLIGAGERLALDLYQHETSKSCRFLLEVEELAKIMLTHPVSLPLATTAVSNKSNKHICANPGACHAMQTMLTTVECKRDALSRLASNVQIHDDNIASLTIAGTAKKAVMTLSDEVEPWRPRSGEQEDTSGRFCRARVNAQSHGLDNHYLRYRCQHEILLYGLSCSSHDTREKVVDSRSR